MIEQVINNEKLLAIIIRDNFNKPGISFFTPNNFSQQLAFMRHPTGKIIDPHVHNPIKRTVHYTQEVLLLKKGKIRVDFYDEHQNYLESRILQAGEVILLASGGHGFEILEEIEMIEVKQGPYTGKADKNVFTAVANSDIIVK